MDFSTKTETEVTDANEEDERERRRWAVWDDERTAYGGC